MMTYMYERTIITPCGDFFTRLVIEFAVDYSSLELDIIIYHSDSNIF